MLAILLYKPAIAQWNKFLFDRNKEVVTETKSISSEEFYTTVYGQMKLAQRFESTTKYSLVAKEVREGYEEASETLDFLRDQKY
ncbi:hypothetical protein [Tepidibacillus fermentans]|uniref:Uncharacterized protein n=1 Tax=Tepidibacillus fermentans TaxID=1281767 RepID=A0A4R3KKX2_9BACI|nr:hypothetical protein [Tepidibacillus fermentans]TCS83976.1 hypothetical protein EDD72_10214 [Tepidibacillus fermentans]